MSRLSVAIVASLLAGSVVPASADAVLRDIKGAAMVSQPKGGFAPASAGTALPAGSRVVVSPKSEAVVQFDRDCAIPLAAGQVFTVTDVSPCGFNAQMADAGGGSALIGVGMFVVGGGIALGLGLSSHTGGSSLPILPTVSK